jgi:hypothetical protein
MQVYLYLTDGFHNDHVVIKVDGRKVFDERNITTNKLLGLAEEVPVTLPHESSKIEVELPDRNIVVPVTMDSSKGMHIPISLQDGRLSYSVERELGFM